MTEQEINDRIDALPENILRECLKKVMCAMYVKDFYWDQPSNLETVNLIKVRLDTITSSGGNKG